MTIIQDTRIEFMPLSELTPSPYNKAKDHDLGVILESIQAHGFNNAPVWDERMGCLVAGHGRRKALLELFKQGKMPKGCHAAPEGDWFVPVQRGWASKNDAQHRKFVLADNEATIKGGWLQGPLVDELKWLAENDDLMGSGFSGDDLDAKWKLLGYVEPVGIEEAFGALPEGEKGEIVQMTFTLHREQAQMIQEGICAAKAMGPFVDTGNPNNNGNALARLVEMGLGTIR